MKKGFCLAICLICLFAFTVPTDAVEIPYQDLNGDWTGTFQLTDSTIDFSKLLEGPTALPSDTPSSSLDEGCDQLIQSMGPILKEMITQLQAGVPVTVNLTFNSPTSGVMSFTEMDLKMPEGTSPSDTSSPIPFQYDNGHITAETSAEGTRTTFDGTVNSESGGYRLSGAMRAESVDPESPWAMVFSLNVSRGVEITEDTCSGSITWLDAIKPGEVLRPVAVYTDGKNSFTPKSQVFQINGVVKRAILWDGSETKVELQFICPHGKSYTVTRTLLPADPTAMDNFGSDTEVQINNIQNVKVNRFVDGEWISVTVGQLQVGDRISAGSSGGSILLDKTFGLNTETLFKFQPNTEIQVVQPASTIEWIASSVGGKGLIDLYKGTLRITGSAFGVKSAQVVTVNSKTDWSVEVGVDDTRVTVFEGTVLVGSEAGGSPVEVGAGFSVLATGENLGSLQPADLASESAGWNAIPGAISVSPSPNPSPSATIPPSPTPPTSTTLPTAASPSATSPPTPQLTTSGTFLGLSSQWWIIGGAGLVVLLLAVLVLVLIIRSGRRQRQVPTVPYLPPVATPPPTICPTCGSTLPPGQRFCGNCGADSQMTAIPPVASPFAPPATICPNCGRPAVPGQKYCQGCGNAIPGSPA
jgi:hypothetical protein